VFALDDVLGAEEAFLASTARLAQPVAAIGETELAGAPGAQTLRAQGVIERAIAEGSIACKGRLASCEQTTGGEIR
jgi:branched-subunit amino acid aminotransferase/4-amino-4-deoxychorismate lyase